MKIPQQYRVPLGISLVIHLGLLIFLMVELPSTNTYRMSRENSPVKIVNAVAVSQNKIDAEVNKLKEAQNRKLAQEQARRANEEERLRQLQQQALVLKRQRLAAQKQVAELKERQLQLNKAEEKRISAEKQKSLAVKAAKEKQAKALATKQTQLQKELLQQQMAQEQQAISSARATQMQGVLDQYKAAILQAIQNRWIVPDDADKTRSCILLIRLGPGGVVLSVDTVKSSGDPVLDRSAQVAVFKSSPLPVPQDPSIFEKFRELRLTVRPLQVTQQAG